MTSEFYRSAVAIETRVCLGLRLRPLSLGHVILLHRLESAFVTGGLPDFNDLAASVLICASTFKEGCGYLTQDLSESMKAWADKLTGMNRWLVRLGFRKPKPIEFEKECATFAEYLKEHSKVPNYSFNPGDFRELDCPQVQMVKVSLMRDMGFTEDELMDRSWSLCLCDYVTLKAMAGHVQLYSEDVLNSALEAANALAKAIKEGKAKCQS